MLGSSLNPRVSEYESEFVRGCHRVRIHEDNPRCWQFVNSLSRKAFKYGQRCIAKGEASMKSKRTKERTRKWCNHNYYGVTSFSAFTSQTKPIYYSKGQLWLRLQIMIWPLVVLIKSQLKIPPNVRSTPLRVTIS